MLRVLCLALALIAAAPAHADELSELVDRYVAWRGGAAYERLNGLQLEAEMHGAGAVGPARIWRDRSGRLREEYDLGPLKGASAVGRDPRVDSWQERNGVVEDMSEAAAEDARRRAALEFADALRGKAQVAGQEARDGRTWTVVRLGFAGPDTYDAFLDPATGELLGFRIVTDRRPRFLRLGDWRLVDGVRIPFAQEETTGNEAGTVRLAVRAATLNPPLPDDLFQRPESRRIATFANGADSTGAIPFKFIRGNRIYIPATVAGQPVEVLLDSGAEMTILDKGWAERAGLKIEGRVVATGAGGQAEAAFARGVTIEVGGLRLPDLTVGAIDLDAVSKALGTPLPVILGADIFKQLIVDLDFEARTIAFHEPEGFQPPPGAATVPVKESSSGIRTVPISIEGGPPVQVDFDIGNGAPFILGAAYWEPRRLLEGRPSSTTLSGAVGGLHEKPIASLRSLEFGGVRFRDVPAIFDRSTASAFDSDRSLGNVGLPLLARFRMMTDYPNDRLYLVPLREADRPFPKNRTGLRTQAEAGKLKVVHVSPGSPAQAAGFKSGDLIAAVDGRSAADLPQEWSSAPAGQTMRLILGDGSEKSLVLRDYY